MYFTRIAAILKLVQYSFPGRRYSKMGRYLRTRREISQWHDEFEQIKQEWLEWLHANVNRYKTIDDAWQAFKAQRPLKTALLDVDSLLNEPH
jgi:predicted component of type VI protein secretion system